MLMRTRSRAASALLIAVTLLSTAALGESQYGELPNFQRVNEHLYRGGQPRPGGIKKLGNLGIKAIVNLRGEDDLSRAEEKEAAAAHIRYFKVPMAGIGRPADTEISKVMAIIDNPENWPVFIHCKHGSDRTGTVVACYRISHDNWDGERATAEAKKFGMSWVEVGMRGYIADYYKTHFQTRAKPVVSSAAKPAVSTDAKPPVSTDTKPAVPTDAKPAVSTDAKPAVSTDAKPAVPTNAKPTGSTRQATNP